MDAVLVALPELLFSLLSALPLTLGTIAAIRHMRSDSRSGYYRHLAASIAAGAVALALLWSSLFGDSLSKSSTGGLIFAVAPFYAAFAQGIVYGIAAAIFRKSTTPQPVSPLASAALLAPLLLLGVLIFGLVKTSSHGNDGAIADRTSNPDTMRQLLEKSRTGEADSFSVPLHLAGNPDAPPDILSELAKHEHPAVRAQVASNPHTPEQVVAALRYDCSSFVRKIVVKRLGPDNALQPAPAPTGVCAQERWR